ncbi:class I SAM-dependent methyltransferase [Thiohalophilus sp.]|uniref:class I SAM-dependent methyltransferase n=1 Tax=Thiohalophilus sp. TaxID=3028392 RepID=UPI002ACE16A5|nr:class I SAM-dependent methyltransferase [Thiohalophilus sp.]MDZ7662478.1 class I SAM-dependent methyltransferase [Thiohalophilus sp.]
MSRVSEKGLPEFEQLKQQLKATWSAGNYADVAETLAPSTLQFLERHPARRGARVLDVACGAGQVAIPAARAGAEAYGIDIAENLIEQARDRAAREELSIHFEVGDAESLPYEDDSFDQVYSVIGAMFAPRPERVAAELKRVCRPGDSMSVAPRNPDRPISDLRLP